MLRFVFLRPSDRGEHDTRASQAIVGGKTESQKRAHPEAKGCDAATQYQCMVSESKYREVTVGSEKGVAFQADVDKKADAGIVKEPPQKKRKRSKTYSPKRPLWPAARCESPWPAARCESQALGPASWFRVRQAHPRLDLEQNTPRIWALVGGPSVFKSLLRLQPQS